MAIKVKIWWDPTIQAYRVATPFNERYVEAIKLLVPASDRSMDFATKTWIFNERFLAPMQALCGSFWNKSEIVVVTRQQAETQAQQSQARMPVVAGSVLANTSHEFLALLPYESAKKAYLHAATQLHPDKGGDAERMSKINSLWSILEKEVWKK